jgi:hypothetical protein
MDGKRCFPQNNGRGSYLNKAENIGVNVQYHANGNQCSNVKIPITKILPEKDFQRQAKKSEGLKSKDSEKIAFGFRQRLGRIEVTFNLPPG